MKTRAYSLLWILMILGLIGLIASPNSLALLAKTKFIKSSGTITLVSPLHVEGRYIKNEFGRIVILNGVNKVGFDDEPTGWWCPQGSGWYDGYGTWNPEAVKQNLDAIKSWGCNLLVLHDVVEWWFYNTDSHKQRVKSIITWAGERGLYVLYNQGAPLHWIEGVQNGRTYLPYPPYRIDPPISPQEYANLQDILPDEASFINNRVDIANELKEFSNVLIGMWGEPCAQFGNKTVVSHYWDVIQQAVDGMRSVGYDGIISLTLGWDTCIWGNMDWAVNCPVDDTNILYSIETYCHDSWKPAWEEPWYSYDIIKGRMVDAGIQSFVEILNKPLLCQEIGANIWYGDVELERELEAFTNILTIFNEWEIGYSIWWWRQGGAWDIFVGDYYTFEPNMVGQIFINAIENASSPVDP